MDFRVEVTVEVDQIGNALAIQTPVPIQLVYRDRRWRARCESPPVATALFDTMEEAIVAGAEQVATEIQANVNERPLIVGRITPDSVPAEMF